MPSRTPAGRHGLTLVEMCIVVAIIGLTTLIASRQLVFFLDRSAARAAVTEAASVVVRARDEAVAQRAMTSVWFDTLGAALELRSRGAPLSRAALGHAHGVTLSANRDSLAFDVRGLGYGASNLTMVARRGHAAETLVVSRLGRVRW
jgi:prepilin-type N-terminal cleavage/methylation domain-containing protein